MGETDVRQLAWGDFYRRMGELTQAYLRDDYDRVYFTMRGGMTPAHRLAHLLGVGSGGDNLHPIYIRRHQSDEVQAATVEPVLARPLEPVPPGAKLLLVEDTVGEGKTAMVAISALSAFQPAVLDVVSVGLDHRDWLMKSGLSLEASPLRAALIGFDYWGWMVFPWENQAAEGQAPSARPEGPMPLALRDDQYAAVAGAVLGPGGGGDVVVIGEANLAEARQLARESADWVIVRDLLPSRLGILRWRELAGVIKWSLRPGGRLVFAYMDRTRIEGPRDISPDVEYYTPDLTARLLAKVGFKRTEHLGSSERASFARATVS